MKRRIAWVAGATVLCATSVLATSGHLGFSLRPGYAGPELTDPATFSARPATPAAVADTPIMLSRPPEAAETHPEKPQPLSEVAGPSPAPLVWLRPALSEEDFSARFESRSPGLAFAAVELAPVAMSSVAPDAAQLTTGGMLPEPSTLAPRVVDVRPPVRPAFPRRRLASLDRDALLTAEDSAPSALDAPSPDLGRTEPVDPERPNLFGSWTDPFARDAPSPSVSQPALQAGMASWYGPGFHGRRTASGERFNQHALTAAHPKLPFGTRIRVVNERTGRSVVVRINDRGPFAHGRIIDLSRGSAQALGMLSTGRVKLVSADD